MHKMPFSKCVNSKNIFCYICGKFMVTKQIQNITPFVKEVYSACFGISMKKLNKSWVPNKVCRSCVECLRLWKSGKKKAMPFSTPMIWRKPKNHNDDCYFCAVNLKGFNAKNKEKISYGNVASVTRPVFRLDSCEPTSILQEGVLFSMPESQSSESQSSVEAKVSEYEDPCEPKLFSQSELNNLTRNLNLTKESAELLGSTLKSKNLLLPGTVFSWYRHREKELLPYFSEEEYLVYCNNISAVMDFFGVTYDANDWRLFIDSSKRSLKGVLLHNKSEYASVPIAHSVHLKENYANIGLLLKKVNYEEHKWMLCGDFKVLGLLLGQQAGFTKMPCFLCEWDSRARNEHWERREWPLRANLVPGTKNIQNEPLVDPKKVILPPLHIKLGIMKQFVKALNKEGDCFKYICSKFPTLTYEKLKAGIFVGPQIRKLMLDTDFEKNMNCMELQAWDSFKNVVKCFLGNNKDPNYKEIVHHMLENFKKLGCNMSVKLHFLFSHIDYFPENLGKVSEEQGERFHQDIKEMESRYQGKWNRHMMADYCWMLKRDPNVLNDTSRKCKRLTFFS